MDHDRAFEGRLRDQGAHPLAAIVVLTLTAVVGIGLMTNDGDVAAPAPSSVVPPVASPVASSTAAPGTTPRPAFAVAPKPSISRLAGLVGLPPEGAQPSTPEVGELVDSYWIAGGRLPYRGWAQLYADGRLIWNRYYDGPGGHNAHTTGYLEQRLTREGVELVKLEKSLARKDPLELPVWLPLGAWEARTPVPYVPSGYGICLTLIDPRPGNPPDGTAIEPSQLVELLPGSVSSLLRGREFVSPLDFELECVAQTIEEVRVLDGALRDGGFDQEAFINRFMVQYSVDVPGAWGMEVWLMFEPRFPDGSIGCSACG